MMSRYLNLVGLAFRAGQCITGEEKIVKDIQQNRAKLVLVASDTGYHTKKKLMDKCQTYGIPVKIVDDRYTLAHAIGKSQRVALAIRDSGFAAKIETLLSDK